MDRRAVPFQDRALAAGVAEHHLRAHGDRRVLVGRQVQLGAVTLVELEREDLAEAIDPLVLEHDVAAEPQLEAVQGCLEREAAPVDRRGERQHRGLELPSQGAEAREPPLEHARAGRLVGHVRGGHARYQGPCTRAAANKARMPTGGRARTTASARARQR